MYIFGVYECVFSVVAVGSQPILCKGLKQTIIQWQWIRQTEGATRIDDIIKHHTLSSEAIIYSSDYSSAFNFCWPFNYFIKLNYPLVLTFISFENYTFKCHTGSVMYLVDSDSSSDGSSASVTGLLKCFLIWVDSLQNRAHCLVWWVALL